MKHGGGITEKCLEFGDRVIVKNKLERYRKDAVRDGEGYYYGVPKVWEQPSWKDFNPTEGIFLGYRTLNDGYRKSFSDHIEYRPKEYFTAALVATNANTNPFYSTEIERIGDE